MKFKTALFDFPVLGKRFFRNRIIKAEGGEQTSITLREYAINKHKVYVEMYSYGGMFAQDFNIGGEKVAVGRYCSFASAIEYYGANHPMAHATMSPYFYNHSFGLDVQDVKRFSLSIGHDVWIGYGVIITCGCHLIGNGAVIGAGSVVTKDVAPYSVVAGVPAKKIRMRFDEATINILEKSKWWELDPHELYNFYKYINRPFNWAEKIIEYRATNFRTENNM